MSEDFSKNYAPKKRIYAGWPLSSLHKFVLQIDADILDMTPQHQKDAALLIAKFELARIRANNRRT